MFECSVWREGVEQSRTLGLNETTVLAGPPFSMIEVQLYVDADLATTYSCDGLIVSTPVGSTAHNLAAGGPIMQKSLQTFVVSPICPHTLTNRPVVDDADHVYELAAPKPNAGTSLLVDGKLIGTVAPEDRIRIERSSAQFQLIEVRGRGYYRTLREKLGWGGRLKLTE
jgi:NAD+ kinase